MGNSNVKNSSGQYANRPHSVLGVRGGDDRYTITDPDVISRYYNSPSLHPHPHHLSPHHHLQHLSHQHQLHHPGHQSGINQDRLSGKVSGKAILPPLPRSHSFHQILRPTENGVNLIQKGTIRGIDHHLRHQNSSGKELLPSPSSDDLLNPELNAILRERRCKSEADLLGDGDEDDFIHREDNKSEKSTERSIEGLRKGLTGGVAARIQRSKYKAPAPPVPVNRSSNDQSNGNANNNSNNSNNHPNHQSNFNANNKISECNQIRSNGEVKMSSSSMMYIYFDSDVRDSGRSLKAKDKSSTSSVDSNNAKPNLGLIRRLSDKSYFPMDGQQGKPSNNPNHHQQYNIRERSGPNKDNNFMLKSRLKGSPTSNGDNLKRENEMKLNRFSNLDDYQVHSDGNEPSLNEINDFIARELALRSINDCPNGEPDAVGGRSGSDIGAGRRGVRQIFKRDKSNGKHNNSFNGGSSQEINSYSAKNGKSFNLPPVFDDNFILKRTTPNAGLNRDYNNGVNVNNNRKIIDLYPSRINNLEFDKNKYNQEGQMSPKMGLSPSKHRLHSSTTHQQSTEQTINQNNIHSSYQQHHFDGLIGPDRSLNSSSSPSSTDYHRTSSNQHHQRHQQSPTNQRSQWILSSSSNNNVYSRENSTPISSSSSPSLQPNTGHLVPPPTQPSTLLTTDRKFDLKEETNITSRLDSLKHLNHSSISDSANYSDEDDEEEIKVVLKPYLPPPRRLPFNEEPIIIADDLFNMNDHNIAKSGLPLASTNRQLQCWTPMEDLSSTDDDDVDDIVVRNGHNDEDDDDGIHCDPQSEDDDNGKRDVRELINDYNTRFTLKNQLRTIIQNNKLRSSQGYP